MSKDYAERLYRHYKKGENGNYIIEVMVPELNKFFSPYDPTPIHEKDIDPAVMNMILSQIVVFPQHMNLELHIHLPMKLSKKNIEPHLERAIRHHFEYELLDNELHLERRFHKGMKTLGYAAGIFITLFTSSYILSNISEGHVVLHLLAEGLAVGAWVSMWHPIETLLYDWLPLYENKKKYSRLKDMAIRFKYI